MAPFDIAHETYNRQISRARGGSGYFLFFRNYGKILTKIEALFLQDLINRAEIIRIQEPLRKKRRRRPLVDPCGYFQCTTKFMANEKYLQWSIDEQKRLFPLLEKKKFVEVKRHGYQGRRWVRVNYYAIELALDTMESNSGPDVLVAEATKRSVAEATVNKQYKNNYIPDNAVGSERNGDNMGFGLTPDKEETPLPDKTHHNNAMLLKESLHKKGLMLGKKVSIKRWAAELALLEKQVADPDRIQEVLTWYTHHVGEEFVPEAYSAKSFRVKFAKIASAARKDMKRNPTIEVTPPAAELARWLGRFHWPAGAKDRLPAVVQLSMISYSNFIKKVREVYLSTKDDLRQLAFHKFVSGVISNMGMSQSFLERWFTTTWKSVKNWKQWSGDITQFTFAPDHKTFQIMGRTWSHKSSGSAKLWELLMERINAG